MSRYDKHDVLLRLNDQRITTFNAVMRVREDAVAYIQQLERQLAQAIEHARQANEIASRFRAESAVSSIEPQGKPLTWAGGYAAGRDSVLRKNVSGCCCKLDEQGDELVEPCALHAAWRDSAVSAIEENADTELAEQRDAERYRWLKTRLGVPGAVASWLRFNNWSPDTSFEPSIDAAIDKAMAATDDTAKT